MRERFVTRTIKVSDVKVMVVDMDTRQVETCEVTVNLAGVKDAEKAVKAAIPEGKVFVAVESKSEREMLMGMPEAEFIKLAKELPPRTKEDDAE